MEKLSKKSTLAAPMGGRSLRMGETPTGTSAVSLHPSSASALATGASSDGPTDPAEAGRSPSSLRPHPSTFVRTEPTQRVAVVTGASSGIGEAIARALAREGFLVYAAARRVERMRDLEALGVRVLRMDLTDDTSITGAIARVQHEAGRVDVLVNNAGYGAYGALEDVPLEHARRQVEVNLFGLARSIQLVLPMMREQRAGRIINISSIGGKIHEPMGGWYHATKFAVEGLSDCLRMELAPFGIHVVVVLPGAVKSEWSRIARESLLARSADGPYAEQAALVGSLMQRADEGSAASPEAVAKAVVKAATKRRPKTRYAMGGGAKPLLALRWLLSDRAFDGLMRFAMRFASRASRGASRAG